MITVYVLFVFFSGVVLGSIARDTITTIRSMRRSRLALRRLRESITVDDCVTWKPLPPQEFQGYSE